MKRLFPLSAIVLIWPCIDLGLEVESRDGIAERDERSTVWSSALQQSGERSSTSFRGTQTS